MDSIPDLPAVTAQPEAHAATSNGAHPPYSEMIVAAIAGLKDQDGSSRQAIAKYIEKEYPNLPPTFPTLLTHHLKRMKNQGELMMVKHSYMLPPPRSVPFQPMETDYSVTAAQNSSVPVQPKRKPGRPPKPRHDFGFQQSDDVQPYQPQFEHHLGASGQDFQSGSGSGQEFQGNYAGGTEPIFVSLGLADEGVPLDPEPAENTVISPKRGRGRPPKGGGVSRSVGGDVVETENRGLRRKVGRPKLLPVTMVNGGGRPKRIGRPVTVPLSGNVVMRPRGRPKRAVNSGGGESGRRRGRPRKTSGPKEVGGGDTVVVADPHQLVAYQELNLKYEHLQSKAKEVLSMVKPYINSDYGLFGAVQEVETLVNPQSY